jgi:hypothetical protein
MRFIVLKPLFPQIFDPGLIGAAISTTAICRSQKKSHGAFRYSTVKRAFVTVAFGFGCTGFSADSSDSAFGRIVVNGHGIVKPIPFSWRWVFPDRQGSFQAAGRQPAPTGALSPPGVGTKF